MKLISVDAGFFYGTLYQIFMEFTNTLGILTITNNISDLF